MPQHINIGPLKALIVEKASKPLLNIVLFHGYGANALNLYPLNRYLDVDDRIKWVFPEGPELIDMDFSGLGRAWFPLDIEAFQRNEPSCIHLPDLNLIVEKTYQALKPLCTSNTHLVIGGFSQGAILTANLMMKTDLNVAGLIVLSGALLDQQGWKEPREGLPFFQSHGHSDLIIPYLEGQKLETALKNHGLAGHLLSFEGGHEISENVLTQLRKFLLQLITSLTA